MATISWANPVSGTFATAADWSTDSVPGSGDDVLLTVAGANYSVTVAAGATVNSLQTAANATLAVANNVNFDMVTGTGAGANAGQITVGNNDYFYLGGTFDNTSSVAGGGLQLNGAANATVLYLLSPSTVFTGGGSVVLGTSGNNYVEGNSGDADTLVNVNNTFSGVGNIGGGSLTVNNETAGVINANQTGQLVLNANGGVTNTGTLEATNTGGLFILNTGVTNTGGTISATGTGAHVDLQNTTIAGGTLKSASGDYIDVAANQTAYLYGAGAAGAVTITAGSNVQADNNTYLYLAGSIVNDGTITVLGAANLTDIRLRTNTTTLTGGGQVVMGATGNNTIVGDAGDANTLVNTNNTISGVGNLGDGGLTFVNQAAGVVNANQTGALTLDVNGGVTNTGLLEATNTGGLFIVNTGIDNGGASNGGKIYANTSGAHVDLQNSTISGGTLKSVAGAYIDIVANQTSNLDGSQPGAPILLASGTTFDVNNNAVLYLDGAIQNQGVINLLGVANATEIRLTLPVTTLSGGGQVVLGGTGDNYIYGNGGALDELDNTNNTISGVGNLGDGQMTFVNEAAGVVNANQTGALTLDVNGGVTNKGLLEATNTGGLFILNTGVDNTLNGNAGHITASGAGAIINLQSSTIYGGVLTTTGAGAEIAVVAGQAATFDGISAVAPVTITAGSTVQINNDSSLSLEGVINNAGTIVLGVAGEANNTFIRLASPVVTLEGGGVVQLANAANNYIYGVNNYSEILDNVNNTIEGSGNLGDNQMTMINGVGGVIDANQVPGTYGSGEPGQLVLEVNGGVTNYGAIEATVGAGQTVGGDLLILNTTILEYSTGNIDAVGTSTVASTVYLQNSTLEGGTLNSSGGPSGAASSFVVVSGQSATLDGTIFNIGVNAAVDVSNNSTLTLRGNVNVSKSINLQAAANYSYLSIGSGSVDLTGAGFINLGNSANNIINSNNGAQNLTNYDDDINGAGNIGQGDLLQITNQTRGVINANQVAALTLQVAETIENYGLIESSTTVAGAGGLFVLNTNIDNTAANALGVLNTGVIEATGTGHVDLQNSNIYGGTLTATGTAYFDVVAGQAAGLNGNVTGQSVNISSGTQFNINNNSTLYLYGTINNSGSVNLVSAGNSSYLQLASGVVTLTGGGQINFGGTNSDFLYESQGNAELNNVNNSLVGGGTIGGGEGLYLNNGAAGTIDATAAAGFAINLGGNQLINAGTLLASGGAISVANSVFNTGRIIADGANIAIAGNVNGAGSDLIVGASTLSIGESVGGASAQVVTFAESGAGVSTGTFKLLNAQDFTGSVVNFATGDTLDLANVSITTANLTYSGNSSGGVLTVTDGTTTANINLVGNYTQANFALVNDGAGHTDVTYTGTAASPIIVDTAANLTPTAMNTAQANSAVKTILVSDSGISTGGFVVTTVAELTADAGAITELVNANGNPIKLQVSDTALDLSGTGMDTIQANALVTSVIVSDNGASNTGRVQVNVAQLTSDAHALSELVFANGSVNSIVRISDTAANISADLNVINTDRQIGRMWISDNNALTGNVAQLTSDATALAYTINTNGTAYKYKVTDTAADVSGANLDALQANGHVSSIVVSDNGSSNGGFVTTNINQLTTDAAVLAGLSFANGHTTGLLNVIDTAANISNVIGTLNSDTQIGQITISDNNPIQLSEGIYTGDTAAIGELKNANATPVIYDIADNSTDFNGASLTGFINAGDVIDVVNISFAHISATFTENGAGTSGVLNLTDGTHTAAITLFGQYAAAGFSGQATAAGFSVVQDSGTGTKVTLLSTVPA